MNLLKTDPAALSKPVNRILKEIPVIRKATTWANIVGMSNVTGVTKKGLSVGVQSLNEILYRNSPTAK